LSEAGREVLAVDTDPVKLRDLPCDTMLGNVDHIQVFESAGVERASMVISALQIEESNNLLTYRCRSLHVPVAVHAFDGSVFDDLRRYGADVLIDSKMQGNVRLVTILAEEGIVDA